MGHDFDDDTPEKPATLGDVAYAVRDIYRRLKGGNAKFALIVRALFVVGTFALGSLGTAITFSYRVGSFVEKAEQAQAALVRQGERLDELAATARDQREQLLLLQQKVSFTDALRDIQQALPSKADALGRRKPR